MPICSTPDDDCYGCRLRAKGLSVAPSATPSRMNSKPPPSANPSWERGVAGEYRQDGSFMPYLGDGLRKIHVKEAGENRKVISDRVRRLRHDPNVFTAERQTPA